MVPKLLMASLVLFTNLSQRETSSPPAICFLPVFYSLERWKALRVNTETRRDVHYHSCVVCGWIGVGILSVTETNSKLPTAKCMWFSLGSSASSGGGSSGRSPLGCPLEALLAPASWGSDWAGGCTHVGKVGPFALQRAVFIEWKGLVMTLKGLTSTQTFKHGRWSSKAQTWGGRQWSALKGIGSRTASWWSSWVWRELQPTSRRPWWLPGGFCSSRCGWFTRRPMVWPAGCMERQWMNRRLVRLPK